jgi:hypothetical protein
MFEGKNQSLINFVLVNLNMKKISIFIFLSISLVTLFRCERKVTDNGKSFRTYKEAVQYVRNTKFKITEYLDTSKSSWIRGASFHSSDGKSGYMIIETDKKPYIHEGVPLSIWKGFKSADSFGKYYLHNLKSKYRIYLKGSKDGS